MADFIARIKPRKSSISGESPTAADLDVAEIAVNTADGKLFVKHTDNTIKEISGGGGGGLAADGSVRTSVPQITTSALAQYSSDDVTFFQTGRAGQFLKVESSCAAWVVFYSSKAARTADASRQSDEVPSQGTGVLMEVFFDQAETALITPAVFYFNDEPNEGAEIYAKVQNLDSTTQAVSVTATVVPIEGRALYEAEGTARLTGLSVETSLLAPGVSEQLTLSQTARSGQFISLYTSAAARVIFYSTTAARTADALRNQGDSPLASSGVLMEAVTNGAQNLEVTPAILYQNSEPGAAGELYMSVTNLGTIDTAITVTTTVVPIEGRGVYLSELHELLDVDAATPADGETLIYNGSTQEWQPGAVSLGIQDANDFALNQELDPLAFNSEFTISTHSTGGCQTAGNIAPQFDSNMGGDGAIVSRFNSDGVDVELPLLAYSGSTLYLAVNGGASQAITIGTVSVYTGCAPASTHRSLFVGNAALRTAIDNAQVGDTVKLSSDPYTDIALADGDILQWNDADSKFKPAELPAVIDKATLQTELAAATNFADFQSRIAAL